MTTNKNKQRERDLKRQRSEGRTCEVCFESILNENITGRCKNCRDRWEHWGQEHPHMTEYLRNQHLSRKMRRGEG